MPVKIACPKCSKNYTLPDSALGKPVKCKECGTAFRTRKPDAAAQPPAANRPVNPAAARPSQPAQAKPVQQANSDLSQFGVEGGFQKQADIFGAPPSPQVTAGLGNFAEEGFGEAVDPIVLGPEGGAPVVQENPYQSVMTNSALKRGAKRSGLAGRKNKNSGVSFNPDAYKVARIGMMMVLGAGAIQMAIGVLLAVVSIIASFVQPMPEGLAAIIGIFGIAAFVMWAISMLLFFFGQILCIFAPESNEKLNAGVSLGLMFLTLVSWFIFVSVAGISIGSFGGSSAANAFTFGIVMLFVAGICTLMALAAAFMFVNYYRLIGKNINSKKLEEAGSKTMMAMAGSIGLQVLLGLLVYGLGFVLNDPETIGLVIQGIALLNWVISFTLAALTLRLIGLAISTLRE